jgi:hypothetical protein
LALEICAAYCWARLRVGRVLHDRIEGVFSAPAERSASAAMTQRSLEPMAPIF